MTQALFRSWAWLSRGRQQYSNPGAAVSGAAQVAGSAYVKNQFSARHNERALKHQSLNHIEQTAWLRTDDPSIQTP